jgi:hypothetical protein
MKRALLFASLLFTAVGLRATSSSELGGVFQEDGVGTRPLGMGGAYVAVADDANAAEENPAGLAFLDPTQHYATFTHSDLYSLGFLTRDYLAYAQGDTWGFGAMGFSWNRLSANLNPGQWTEDAFQYAGAKQVLGFDEDSWPKLALGWQASYLRVSSDLSAATDGTSVGDASANGLGCGLGALLKFTDSVSMGVAAQNIYSRLAWATGTDEVEPMLVKGGLAWHITADTLVSGEYRENTGSGGLAPESWHAGAEHWFMDGKDLKWGVLKNVGIRAGYYEELANADGGTATVGATIQSDTWQIEYTYEYGLSGDEQLGDTQRFGLGVQF